MITLFCFIILIATFYISNHFYKNWFNHLNLYVFGWTLFISLYQLKLIRFTEVRVETWFIVLNSYIAIFLGSVTFFFARKSLIKDVAFKTKQNNILLDDSIIKYLKILIIFFSILGLFAALQNWFALINKYGTVAKVLLKANTIYRDRIAGEDVGGIPYLFIASYIGVFFAGIYTSYKKRMTFIASLPFLGIILKGIASVGRGGIFVGFLQFLITTFLFYHYLKHNNKIDSKLNYKSMLSFVIILIIVVGSMAIVKEIRGSFDSYKGTTKSLKSFEGSIISPQIYLYFSSNIAVLSKYFEKDSENVRFGENTLLPIYNVLAKFGIIEQPKVYPKGYFIPMWTNSATYLRDIHADFGYVGLFIIPYILGLVTSIIWFKFNQSGKLIYFVILTYLYIIISFSVFYMITRAASWFVSFILLLCITPIFEKYLMKRNSLL